MSDLDGTDRLRQLVAKVGGPRRFATTKHKYVAVTYACEEHHRKVAEVIRTPLGPVVVARTMHIYQEGGIHQPEAELGEGLALPAFDVDKPLRGRSAQDTVWALDKLDDTYTIAATSRCGQVHLRSYRIVREVPTDNIRVRVIVPHSR